MLWTFSAERAAGTDHELGPSWEPSCRRRPEKPPALLRRGSSSWKTPGLGPTQSGRGVLKGDPQEQDIY